MEIQREVIRQHLFVENIVKQFAVAAPKPNRVMGNAGVLARGAKIQNEQAHGCRGTLFDFEGERLFGLAGHGAVKVDGISV